MPHTGARVLYIDDDAGLRRLATRVLARSSFKVSVAESGAEGVALASAEPFDLIAVDHYMPGMDGLETLKRLRALPNPPPIVYVTGTDEGRIAVAALKAGAADYVVKSVGEDFFDLLASTFAQVIGHDVLQKQKAAAEEQLRATNARLEALLGEVNHRLANSLQLVSAMVRMQANVVPEGPARDALDDTERRIQAIAQVHRRLYTSNDVESVDMQEYLGALIDEIGETLASEAGRRTLRLIADPIRMATDRAVSLGVIVTELVTNACKYAYPPEASGEVRVALSSDGDDRFVLAVEDDGCGMTENAPARGTGLGTRLIKAMAQSLHAAVEYDPGHRGVRAMLRAEV
jgi:two-component sensor histidine kinase